MTLKTSRPKKAKTLIVGIGNPILSDDSVGLKIARRLKEVAPELHVIETSQAGISLLEYAEGFDRLIIVDSIKTANGKPGEVLQLSLHNIRAHKEVSSFHSVNIATAFELGERLGYHLPKDVCIYAIEIKDNLAFGEQCTPKVEKQIPLVARKIIDEQKLF